MVRGSLAASLTAVALWPAGGVAAHAAPAFTQRTVDVSHVSGGELAIDGRRDLVLTADRNAAGSEVRPSISVVDARRQRQRHSISLWALPPAIGEAGPAAHVPQGLDSDETRGLVVTTNSAAATVAVVPVDAAAASAEQLVPVGRHPFGVVVDERRGLAYVASYAEHRVDVIDVVQRRVVDVIEGVTAPTELALDARRGRLYVGNADRSAAAVHELAVVDTRRRAVVERIPVDANSRPSVDPVDGTVYVASFATGAIAEVDPDQLRVRATIQTGTTPHGVAIDQRRGLLYAPNLLADTVTVIDARTAEVIATLAVPGVPLGVDIDRERGRAWVSLRDASRLVVIEPVVGR